MSNFEEKNKKQEVVTTTEESVEKNPEALIAEIKQDGQNESDKVLNTINIVAESALKSVGDDPELAKEINEIVNKAKNNIGDSTQNLKNQLEGEGFGEAHISNPKILDLIAEIEFGLDSSDMKESTISNWKRMINDQYKDALKEQKSKLPGREIIYGKSGYHRYVVTEKGEVCLRHNEGSNLKASENAQKRAQELGVKIID